MNFLYPAFLFALSAISIPIIIHLFNFRRYKTVYFSNIQFLKTIKKKTRSKSQLKHLLVLICRILAIASLVIAFAQPYIPLTDNVKKTDEQEIISIYIDNSFSMDAESKYGNLLEVAKNKARDIINAYRPGSEFLLITNDFELKHQHPVNKEQFSEFLGEIEITPVVKNISEILSRQKDFLVHDISTNKSNNTIFLLSDFQKSSSDFAEVNNDTNLNVHLIPLATQTTNNLYIDSCWFEIPHHKLEQQEELHIKIINKSDESYRNIPVKLFINDSVKALGSFNIAQTSSEIIVLSYTNTRTGIQQGKIEITDYPVTYDNTFYFSYTIAKNIELLAVNEDEENKFINALFVDDEYINITNFFENNIKHSQLSSFQVIILNEVKAISSGFAQELVNYISNGGTVLFFPGFEGEIESYNNFFKVLKTNYFTHIDTHKTKIERINYENEIYSNVFKKTEDNINLPEIYQHFVFSHHTFTKDEAILTTQNNHTIISITPFGKGKIYISAIPTSTEYSNFAKHPIFVPTIYNIALNSQPISKIYYTIGKDETIEISKTGEGYNVFHIINSSNTYDFIPQYSPGALGTNFNVKLSLKQNITKADNYVIKNKEKPLMGIAFNYNRNESDLSFYMKKEILEILKKLDLNNFSLIDTKNQTRFIQTLKQINQGKQLWKLFIILALIFFGIEIALLRLWR